MEAIWLVDGTEADQITKDLDLSSNIPVNVHLVGFVTERVKNHGSLELIVATVLELVVRTHILNRG